MYPDETTLLEVGRIAIAAGRLDAALGSLWWHLSPDQVEEVVARSAPAGKVRDQVRRLAALRLEEQHASVLLALVEEIEHAQRDRNDVLHSRWLLRGRDTMRPVSEFSSLSEDQR